MLDAIMNRSLYEGFLLLYLLLWIVCLVLVVSVNWRVCDMAQMATTMNDEGSWCSCLRVCVWECVWERERELRLGVGGRVAVQWEDHWFASAVLYTRIAEYKREASFFVFLAMPWFDIDQSGWKSTVFLPNLHWNSIEMIVKLCTSRNN